MVMEPIILDDERRRFFDENGYLVVSGALRPAETGALTAAADKLIDDFERLPGQTYVQRRPGIVEEPAFHPLLAHSSTVPLVVQLLSPNIHLHTSAIIYKWPQDEADGRARTWHRDIGITEDMGHAGVFRAGVKVGYCLTDFPEPRAGFTLFAPGSHRLRTPLPIPKGAVDPDGVVDLCLSAGDAFLFENRVFHSTAPNLIKRISKVVILGYSYRWMGGTRDNMRLVQPGERVLRQVDAIRQQLLGGASEGLIEWAREHGIGQIPFRWTMEV